MSAGWSPPAIALGLFGAAVLFLFDLVLSIVLQSVASLSRVALRRLSTESERTLLYLEDVKTTTSTYRAAIQAARQASLLGGTILVAVTAKGAGWPYPWLLGALCGGLVGIVLFETLLARYIALRDPKAALRSTAFLARPLHTAAYPLLRLLDPVLRASERSITTSEEEDEAEADEEVEAFIEVGEREGILAKSEGEMVRGIVDLGETRVREIMVPRTDIFAFPSTLTVAEARQGFLKSTHARVAVYRDTIDDIVGILHVRDLLRAFEDDRESDPISAYVRPAFFVPETRHVAALLGEMRRGHHIAIVVDEYGGVAGLVTLEDLLEEIVGDIHDEHAREEARLEQDRDGSWLVSGLAHVEEIEDLFGLDVGERDYDTVGGFVVSSLGRVPEVGESFDLGALKVEIVRADRKRVYRVRMRPLTAADRGTRAGTQ